MPYYLQKYMSVTRSNVSISWTNVWWFVFQDVTLLVKYATPYNKIDDNLSFDILILKNKTSSIVKRTEQNEH